jgi:hypothetical protein
MRSDGLDGVKSDVQRPAEAVPCGKDFGLSFNSCRNRHCQTQARNRWAARTRELVPLEYFHVVFTLPHQTLRVDAAEQTTAV